MSHGTRTNHRTSIVKMVCIEYRNAVTMAVIETSFNAKPTTDELVERATQLAILHDSPVDILEIVEKVCVECGETCFRSEEWFMTIEPIMEEETPKPVTDPIVKFN